MKGRDRYEVFQHGEGIVCGPVEQMGDAVVAWVSQPAPPFAFGKFLAACTSLEDAQRIADAMNERERLVRR